jgi:hypothetical protein
MCESEGRASPTWVRRPVCTDLLPVEPDMMVSRSSGSSQYKARLMCWAGNHDGFLTR